VAQEQETEQDLGELENRLERLRILYEQYFMGIEKREPGVQHKEVVRRIQQLRKIRFQSTAQRFRFQTMMQRFNTLQQYWTRTCREIENGTYKRHMQRAARRLATVPPSEAGVEEARSDADRRVRTRDAAVDDLEALLDGDVDLEAEMAGALAALEKSTKLPPKGLSGLAPKKEGSTPQTGATLHLGKAASLKDLTPAAKPNISPRLSTSPKPAGLTPVAPRAATGNPLAALGKAPGTTTPQPAPPRAPAATQKQHAQAPAVPAPKQIARSPAAPLLKTPEQGAAARAPIAQKAGPPLAPSLRPQLKQPRTAPPHDPGLSGDRIKALHQSYVEARQKTNASPVSYEKLEKNIRETEQKLRVQHKGRQIDFEVGIKDGKAILKPRLK
jgi:hypothetical protein